MPVTIVSNERRISRPMAGRYLAIHSSPFSDTITDLSVSWTYQGINLAYYSCRDIIVQEDLTQRRPTVWHDMRAPLYELVNDLPEPTRRISI